MLGRFLQADPIGYQDDNNLYAYVGNNPVNSRDPSGLCSATGSSVTGLFDSMGKLDLSNGVNLTANMISPLEGIGVGSGSLGGYGGRGGGGGGGGGRAGGGGSGRIGVFGETAVSSATGIPRNIGQGRETIPGSGVGGYRVPDFPPSVTISQRGSVIEVKNYSPGTTLSATPQFRDLVSYARGNGAVVEVYSNAGLPTRGEFATWVRDGIVRVLPIP